MNKVPQMSTLSVKATVVQVVKHMLCEMSVQQKHKFKSSQLLLFIYLQKKAHYKIPPKNTS